MVPSDANAGQSGAAQPRAESPPSVDSPSHAAAADVGCYGVERLAEGNARFLSEIAGSPDPAGLTAALATADPYAVVIGCSDSRVPPELIFDEGVGRLFVVRVASHVAGQAEIGTIEYAIARWNCRVLLVLGHTQCGAISAAMDRLPPEAEAPPTDPGAVSPNVEVRTVMPARNEIDFQRTPIDWMAKTRPGGPQYRLYSGKVIQVRPA